MQILKRIFGQAEPSQLLALNAQDSFDQARALASQPDSRQVVLVRPDLSLLELACPVADSMPANVIQQMESIVPSPVRRNVAAMTSTGFAGASSRAEVGSAGWAAAGNAIPFFGILNGLGCIGHTVWIFDATSDIAAACRDADILIVDSDVADGVPAGWLDTARKVMRSPSILLHDRASYQLRPIAPGASPPTAPLIAQDVRPSVDWATVFDKARLHTRRGERFQIVLVQPDLSLLCLPCIPRKAMTCEHLAQAHRVIPEGMARNIAVIAPTGLVCNPSDSTATPALEQLRAAGRAIPFFGLLLNLASAGNPLWIFQGPEEAVTFGCREADLLFIDSILAGKLTTRTLDQAAKVMRSENIAVYHRGSGQTAMLRQVGESKDKLEFRGPIN